MTKKPKRPKRIETFQILDLMQEICVLRNEHAIQEEDEGNIQLADALKNELEELNAKLLELLDTLVALQDKP